MSKEHNTRLVDVLSDMLKETYKAVDLSIFVAFVVATFVVMHGLQGDYTRYHRQLMRTIQSRLSRFDSVAVARDSQSTAQGDSASVAALERAIFELEQPLSPEEELRRPQSEVPFLGFQAELSSASFIALILFWVLCIRAALQVRRAQAIERRLAEADAGILAALALWPSLTSASRSARIACCVVLGVLGYAGLLMLSTPVDPLTGSSHGQWITAFIMLVPVAFLAVQLLEKPRANRRAHAA